MREYVDSERNDEIANYHMAENREGQNRGMDTVAEFITKAFHPEQMADSEDIVRFFEGRDGSDFIDLINRYSGILSQSPTRKDARQAVAIEDNVYSKGRLPYFVFMPKERKRIFIDRQYDAIKKLTEDIEKNQEALARSLYFLINYAHPLPDGNGRLSRLLYQLFSPNIKDKSKDRLLAASERSEGLMDAHARVNMEILKEMIMARGVLVDDARANAGVSPGELRASFKLDSFEYTGLGFIRAIDAMAATDRDKYIHETDDGQKYIALSELPADIVDKAIFDDPTKGVEERMEFAERLMRHATQDEHFADGLFKILSAA